MEQRTINGYQIREALKRWRIRHEVSDKQFSESLFVFKSEDKLPPDKVIEDFKKADEAIALLETIQQGYNRQISMTVLGRAMTLDLAVKLVGGAGRVEKMWRTAATSTGRDRYSSREMSRRADEEYAQRVVPQDQASLKADEAARYASALRAAIAEANSKTIEMPSGMPDWLLQ